MKCREDIKWREKSRKFIVVMTDRGFHTALDGKLAGILTPNDGKCHLKNGTHNPKATELDYPSVSLINHVAQEVTNSYERLRF